MGHGQLPAEAEWINCAGSACPLLKLAAMLIRHIDAFRTTPGEGALRSRRGGYGNIRMLINIIAGAAIGTCDICD